MKKIFFLSLIFIYSCSGVSHEVRKTELNGHQSERVSQEEETAVGNSFENPPPPDVKVPEYKPVTEDISPLKKQIVSISVRKSPLRDVVKVITDTAHLNLVMEKGVDPEIPVTITLNNVSVQDALHIILSSVDYFYEMRRNLLIVKAQDTMIFEFGHPPVIDTYSINLGGDILGGVSAGTAGSSTTDTATSGSTILKGDVTLESKTDEKSQNLWDAIDNSLSNILRANEKKDRVKPYFSINRSTGTIIVTASVSTLSRVEDFLTTLRKSLNRQVMIEARIVEVQLDEGLQYGIDWNFVDEWNGVGTVDFGTSGFSDVVPTPGPVFEFGVTGVNFTSLLKALQTQGTVRTLSNPRVKLMNGQTALLSVGTNTNYIASVDTVTTSTETIGNVTFSLEVSSVLSGIVLGIVPYISPDGNVSLTITPIITDLIRLEDKEFATGPDSSVTISLPTVDLREMSTTIRVKDQEMIVIGGLIKTKQSEETNGVPFLSAIPLLGNLFKSVEITEERDELVIMLKPQVTGSD